MTSKANKALLPAGLRDGLPPDAEAEAQAVSALMGRFAQFGYERVKPPLIEFEENLLSGPGAAMAERTFRVMDPLSQRMLAVRPDQTLQVARIASSRLAKRARPLRLSYAGQVLRVRGSQLRPERQFTQVGLELIGPDGAQADAEVILAAVEALGAIGPQGLSVDLSFPALVSLLLAELDLDAEALSALRHALDQKDAAAVAALGGDVAETFTGLIRATGPVDQGLERLNALALSGEALAMRDRISDVVALLREAAPDLSITLDLLERRGFEYHTGLTFILFSTGAAGELGRGGRYLGGVGADESGAGVTLFMDTVLSVAHPLETKTRLFVPAEVSLAEGAAWRSKGYVTVLGHDPKAEAKAEAKRLDCQAYLDNGQALSLDDGET